MRWLRSVSDVEVLHPVSGPESRGKVSRATLGRIGRGIAFATAIGIAGSIVSSFSLPQDQATAAVVDLKRAGKPADAATKSIALNGGARTATRYVVRSGDSLSAIASKYNTTLTLLSRANKLTVESKLQVGVALNIPKVRLFGPKTLPTRLRANPKRLAVRTHTAKWAKANNIPQDLLEATLWQESGFDQLKVSSTGAIGVGQIMPGTAGFIAKELIGVDLNPRVTENNVRMSARYLRFLLKMNRFDSTKALHAYYQGMGSIREHGLYDDTIRYARNVQALRCQFKN